MVTKDEFSDWLRNPVTKTLIEHIEEQVEQAKETLADSAGINPLADSNLVGGIAAFREVIDWKPEYFIDDAN
jgi:hypothetical protein